MHVYLYSVYPSYPETGKKSNVLIVSYCWTQDADRLGALINDDGTAKEHLISLVLRDLRTVHKNFQVEEYYADSYFAWNWYDDPNAMGMTLPNSPYTLSIVVS